MNKKPVKRRTEWRSPKSWRLIVETVTLPGGGSAERGLIEHPGSVVLVPLQGEQSIVMIRQYRAALGQTIIELPAGTREWGEDWLVCAQRELREEIGYRADLFVPLGDIWPAPGFTNELMRIFLAIGLTPDPLPADFDEEIALAPMPLDELVGMATNGTLHDGKSVIGILRAAAHLARQRNE